MVGGALLQTSNPTPVPVVSCESGVRAERVQGRGAGQVPVLMTRVVWWYGGRVPWQLQTAAPASTPCLLPRAFPCASASPPIPYKHRPLARSRRRPADDSLQERRLPQQLWRLCRPGSICKTAEDAHAGGLWQLYGCVAHHRVRRRHLQCGLCGLAQGSDPLQRLLLRQHWSFLYSSQPLPTLRPPAGRLLAPVQVRPLPHA